MTAFYNEIDPFAAAWLRNLIAAGLIADGIVDERDIRDIRPGDLDGFTQVHFFAGIGGWSYALRLAGWPDDRPVWTGSCPCQPFSAAGKGGGFDDERHLWPAFFHLISECRPPVVFGEQVASKDGLAWFDLVHADLEGAGYAVGAADLCAAGVGAPHIRQRLWFVADATGSTGRPRLCDYAQNGQRRFQSSDRRLNGSLGDANRIGQATLGEVSARTDAVAEGSPWAAPDWLPCRDGKSRPTQPGLFPLAHGIPNRVGTLRGVGNAIVPQVAAEIVGSYLDRARLDVFS